MQVLQQTAKVIQMSAKRKKVTTTEQFIYEQIEPFGLRVSPSKETDLTKLEAEDFSYLRELALQHKVLVLRGFDTLKNDDLVNLSTLFGEVLEWIFGSVLDIKIHANPENKLFTAEKIPFHWDGKFAASAPHFQFFQCIKASPIGNGGETVFCDTSKVLAKMTKKHIQRLNKISIEYRTNKLASYEGDIEQKLIAKHPGTKENIIRFAEPIEEGMNSIYLKVNDLNDQSQEEFLEEFVPQLYQDDVIYEHQWKNDDLVIADNQALIHGRNAFSQCIARHIRRVHVL